MTPALMIEKYIQLRNKVDLIKLRHKDELFPYTTVMEQIEGELLKHLNAAGTDSTKAPAGTAYKSTATSVTVSDWPKTLDYIRKNNQWDLLEARVAKTIAVEVITETKKPIPGVAVSQAIVLRVRSA